MGSKGAIIVDKDKAYKANGLQVPVKGTVGAGDSMVAGVVFRMQKGYGLDGLLRSGVASATASIVKDGTQLCNAEGHRRYFEMVKVKSINL